MPAPILLHGFVMLKLYTVPTANGQRASIALEECGLEYDVRNVDLFGGEHRSPEMLALNPFGRMPVLEVTDEVAEPGQKIYGSLAIASYAAERADRLLPESDLRPEYHKWIGVIMTDLVPAFAAQFYLGTLAPEKFAWGIDFYADIIERFCRGIDEHLADRTYFVGDEYCLADVLAYPTATTSLARTPAGLEPYPNIAAWAGRVGARRAVQRGMQASS